MTIKHRPRRYIALIMIMAAIGNLPMRVSAEDTSQNEESAVSKLTADVETDIYQVVMPTETEGIFDFILDPQRLINETNGAMYNGKSFEKDCTVFFKRSDGKSKEDYSCKSDSAAIINKSTMPVEVSLEVKVDSSSLGGIVMTEDRTFKKDKSASLYLAVVDGKKEVPVGKDGVIIRKTVEAAPDGAYGYVYDSNKREYIYGLKKDITNVLFDEYSFQITGAANKKGDWTTLGKAVPKIVVTWKVLPSENAELRKDAILKEDKTSEESGNTPDVQEEDKKPEANGSLENKETAEEQIMSVENKTEKEQITSDDSKISEEENPTVDGSENESVKDDLNDK